MLVFSSVFTRLACTFIGAVVVYDVVVCLDSFTDDIYTAVSNPGRGRVEYPEPATASGLTSPPMKYGSNSPSLAGHGSLHVAFYRQ